MKYVFSVEFILFDESLAMNVILYRPIKFEGIAKELLYLFVIVFWRLISCIVPFGNVIFAFTALITLSSVTFTEISIICERLKLEFCSGIRLKTAGFILSDTIRMPVKFTLSTRQYSEVAPAVHSNFIWKFRLSFANELKLNSLYK